MTGRSLLRFHIGYALLALLVFAVEVVIALYVRDRFVRPYLGDTLAVILVYCGLRAVLRIEVTTAAIAAFAVAVAVELGQFFGVVYMLGLGENQLAHVVLGTGFELKDFAAYAAGALIAVGIETLRRPAASSAS